MPFVDLTDRVVDWTTRADLVVYFGGVRLSSSVVQRLRSRGLKALRSNCRVTFWFERRSKIIGITVLRPTAPWDHGQHRGFRTSYSHRDLSLKFTSARMAETLRCGGEKCGFRLSDAVIPGCDAVFEMTHQDEEDERCARRRRPRSIVHGTLQLKEVME